jgi:hypothetical protein
MTLDYLLALVLMAYGPLPSRAWWLFAIWSGLGWFALLYGWEPLDAVTWHSPWGNGGY